MEESRPGSDDKRASVNRHIQGSGQKRSCSVLRDCEAGGSVAHFDEHQHKRMRGVDHRAFQYLIEHKVTEGHTSDNPYVKEQRKASTTGRGSVTRQRSNDYVRSRVTSSPHNKRKRSSIILNLPPSDKNDGDDDDDEEEEVVRDGGGSGGNTKQQPNNISAGKSKPSPPDQKPTQSCPSSEVTGSSSQSEEVSKTSSQYSGCSNQFTRAGLKPFMNYTGGYEGYTANHFTQNYSFVAANQLCTPRPESRRTLRPQMQRSPQAGGLYASQYFVSPAKSYGPQHSEQFIVNGCQQEMEGATYYFPTFSYPIPHYRVVNARQRIPPSNSLVSGMDSAVVLQQEYSSGQGSTGYLLDISVHSQESIPGIGRTRTYSGDTIEPPVLPACHSPLDNNRKGTMRYHQHNPPSSTQGASWKTSESSNESFYANIDNKVLTSVEPSKPKSPYGKSSSGGLDNQHVPDLS